MYYVLCMNFIEKPCSHSVNNLVELIIKRFSYENKLSEFFKLCSFSDYEHT